MSAKLDQLARCRFMARSEFADGIKALAGKKVVIVGCGAQGLNQVQSRLPLPHAVLRP